MFRDVPVFLVLAGRIKFVVGGTSISCRNVFFLPLYFVLSWCSMRCSIVNQPVALSGNTAANLKTATQH